METIRYTLKQFDQEHPDLAVFPNSTGPLSEEAKKKIYQQYRRGARSRRWPSSYCRTKTSIYRVINEMRAERIVELPLDFIPNPQFAKAGVEKEILARCPSRTRRPRKPGCRAVCRRIWPACTKCRC